VVEHVAHDDWPAAFVKVPAVHAVHSVFVEAVVFFDVYFPAGQIVAAVQLAMAVVLYWPAGHATHVAPDTCWPALGHDTAEFGWHVTPSK
jgi:hypothetical protein